jgi:sulfur-oxidizing protein SoxX
MGRAARLLALLLVDAALDASAQRPPSAPELFVRADKGHCIACHRLPPGVGPQTRADFGPALDGRRMREIGKARLRDVLADPTRANPSSVMPPFGRHRILDEAEIDRVVDFLHGLP